MRAGLVVTGVLGAGTAVVFALAALTATLFPSGTLVQTSWNGPWVERGWGVGGGIMPVPVPMPAPGFVEGDIDVSGDLVVPERGFVALPGDVVVDVPDTEPVPVP